MRIDELLGPPQILCHLPAGPARSAFQALSDHLKAAGALPAGFEPAEPGGKRRPPDALPLGKGVVLFHLRTEQVPKLTLGLATCPDGLTEIAPPDGLPGRVLLLLLVPRKHSELYLRALAALVEALSDPAVMDRVVASRVPAEVAAALQPDEADLERGEILSLLSKEGALDGRVAQLLARVSASELEDLMEDLSPKDRARCFGFLDPVRVAEVTRFMTLAPLTATLRRMPPEAAARVLHYVPSSRCVDVLQRMDPETQGAVLKHFSSRTKEIQSLLKHPPHSAGGLMMPEVLSVREQATVTEALREVGAFKDHRQTIVFVTTEDGKLSGYCRFHTLAGAEPHVRVSELMHRNPPAVEPERDQEELRRLLSNDDIQAIAVLGADQRLLGVVTEDAILSAVEQEANEDLHHIVGTKMVDPLHTPMGLRLRMRMPWLMLTLAGELFIALVIAKVFRSTLEKAAILSAFMPAIMATGGNVGLQATTMVIRSLGMGKLKRRHTARIVLGEVKLGLLLGLACGGIAAVTAYLINWGEAEVLKVSLSVFLAMVSATLATSLVGTVEPLVLHRLKFDPATACGPFVTLFNDMFGCLVYLTIAMLMNFGAPPPL